MFEKKNGRLLLTIVGRGQSQKLMPFIKEAGANGSTVMLGRGTADNVILAALCLGDSHKDAILTLVNEEEDAVADAIRHRSPRGSIMARLRVAGDDDKEHSMQSTKSEWQMIWVIVNTGYADDVMAAAREQGARGGTIFNARGTGTEEDTRFFGITLVPEKEVLMIITRREQSAKIRKAISSLECLNVPGSGIMFTTDADDFENLGKR